MRIALLQYLLLIVTLSSVYAQVEKDRSMSSAEPFVFTRIYADSAGTSHFSDDEMLFEMKKFSPELPPVSVSRPNKTDNMIIITAPRAERQIGIPFPGGNSI